MIFTIQIGFLMKIKHKLDFVEVISFGLIVRFRLIIQNQQLFIQIFLKEGEVKVVLLSTIILSINKIGNNLLRLTTPLYSQNYHLSVLYYIKLIALSPILLCCASLLLCLIR